MSENAVQKQSEFLQVHLAQMNSTDDLNHNVDQILSLLEKVPVLKSEPQLCELQLVCFPENCLYMRVEEGEKLPAVDLRGDFWKAFADVARQKNVVLHLGSVPQQGRTKLTNSSVVIRPGEGPRVSYSKIHLFDIAVEGHKPVRESDAFENGGHPETLQVGDWLLGQSICYDLRFAELYSQYAQIQVDAILVPSAFLVPTGLAHWEVLLRARAVESQAYVLAAAQAGRHVGKNASERQTFGHSLAIDPWGRVLKDAGAEGVSLSSLRLSRAEIRSVRRQIPMAAHRRLTVV